MNIYIFLFCYNEESLIPHTIRHYKTYLPSSHIIIIDNESTDNSVEIAKKYGCHIIPWNTNNMTNEFNLIYQKNNIWKIVKEGWIIMADMDEFLCIDEKILQKEFENGTTVLKIEGVDAIGESEKEDLSDIDIYKIDKFVGNSAESKKLCFLREKIEDMNYDLGAHQNLPGIEGYVKYSKNSYINRHMKYLGLPYITKKMILCYNRSIQMRNRGLDIHYTDNIDIITKRYNDLLQNSLSYKTFLEKLVS